MNKVLGQLAGRLQEEKEKHKLEKNEWESKRRYYRKPTDLNCTYRPIHFPARVNVIGWIKDVSLGGVKLEVIAKNLIDFSHEQGDEFLINTILPTGKGLDLTARIVSSKKDQNYGKFSLGMSFSDITADARKHLGFFLMPI